MRKYTYVCVSLFLTSYSTCTPSSSALPHLSTHSLSPYFALPLSTTRKLCMLLGSLRSQRSSITELLSSRTHLHSYLRLCCTSFLAAGNRRFDPHGGEGIR